MKALPIALFLSLASSVPAFGQSLDETQSCVVVYVKHDATQPNLTIACDGSRTLTRTVPTEDEVESPSAFREALIKEFQALVNSSGRKECNEYDYDNVWWASCLSLQ